MTIPGQFMASEIAEIPTVFARLDEHADATRDVARALERSSIRSVQILARGTSDNAAHYLKYLLEVELGLACGLASPSSVTLYDADLDYRGVAVIALSQSGQSPDLVEYAEAAKRGGARVVSLTNDDASPLAALADWALPLRAGVESAVAATKSYSAQLALSYQLAHAWARKPYLLDRAVVEAQRLCEQTTLVERAIASVTLKGPVFSLGRGFSYANALELALKIQETSKVVVQGYSGADFLHGPVSALDGDAVVFVHAPSDLAPDALDTAVERVRRDGATLVWLGAGGAPLEDEIVVAGACLEDAALSSVVDSILSQRLALGLARQRGLNPDAPTGLSKVTLTR